MCQEHTFSYHSVPGRLIDFVGGDNFYNWIDSLPNDTHAPGYVVERFSIVDFVEQFNVSKEDFLETTRSWMTDEAMGRLGVTREEYQETYGYTDAQIDAIYSGDQSRINEAFCGDLAYYNPSDGQLYSIYWLSGHTYEDYREADLPTIEIDKILTKADEMGGIYAQLAEAAWPEQGEYVGVTETSPVYDSCMEHIPYYHVIDIDLMRYVGEDEFDEWYAACTPVDAYGRPEEDMNIAAFLQHFDIPRDIVEASSDYYTVEQLDALYSGDQSRINEAFCGDLAYYNPSDGQLYSIYWLSDHTAADYQAAGVPVSEVERILDGAAAMGGSYASLAEAAAPAAEAYALE